MTDTNKNDELQTILEDDICKAHTIKFIEDLDPIVEVLLNIDESIFDCSGALAINASFGMGKSFFCKRYSEYLKKKYHYNSFVLNLFLYDSHSEPFAILTQTLHQIRKKGDATLKKALEDTAKLLLETAKCFVPHLGAVADKTIDLLFSEKTGTLEEQVKNYKNALKELAKEKPIVIFIDELDRCKPDFALLFLERLKHYFDGIPGLLFILMINQKRLEEIITHSYGTDSPHEYLEKFLCHHIIDLHTENNQTHNYPGNNGLEHSLLKKLLDSDMKELTIHIPHASKFIEDLAYFAEIMKLTLREIVKLSHKIKGKIKNNTLHLSAERDWLDPKFTSYFLPLIVKYPEIVIKLRKLPADGHTEAYKLLEKLSSEAHDITMDLILYHKAALGYSDAIKVLNEKGRLTSAKSKEECKTQVQNKLITLLEHAYK